MMRAHLALLPLFALAQLACGGKDEGRPSGDYPGKVGAGIDSCEVEASYEIQPLVDFDPFTNPSGDLISVARCDAGVEATCSFYMNYDTASSPENEKTIVDPDTRERVPQYPRGEDCLELLVSEDAKVFTQPEIASNDPTGDPVEGGRCGEDESALHFITRNVGMCVGSDGRAGWGSAFDITFGGLDASDWDGIGFWVKQGPDGAKPAIIVQFVDPFTAGALVDEETLEPSCDSSDPAVGQQPVPDNEKCDAFGTAVTLTDEWSFVPARFDDMAQKGFGVPAPSGHLDTSSITRMQVLIDAGDADFWIDDIALFRNE